MKKYLALALIFLNPGLALGATYIVKPNDTLGGIVRDLGIGFKDISGYTDPNLIFPGDELVYGQEPMLGAATSTIVQSLKFYDELMPDGATCSPGQILKKTGTNDWDCAADDGGAGSGITSINGLTTSSQTFATTTGSGSFDVTSTGSVHTIKIPSNVGFFTNDSGYISTSTGLTTGNFASPNISQWTNNSGYISTSTGLTTANFATTSISQWVNDAGYVTSSGAAGVTTANGIAGAVNWLASGPGLTVASSGQNITYTFSSSSLNLGTASIQNLAAFLQPGNNLSELTSTSTARTNLGVAIGTNVQAFDADLSTLAGLTPATGLFIMGSSTNWVAGKFVQGSNITITTSTPGQVTIAATDTNSGGTVTTSTAVTARYIPFWGSVSALTGTSTIYSSGTGSSARIGIGTISPSTTLHVVGDLIVSATSTIQGKLVDASGNAYVTSTSGGAVSTSSAITANYFPFWNSTAGALSGTSTIARDSSGNIGIGTSTPSSTLHVVGGFEVSSGTSKLVYVSSTSGYVGIGTSTPASQLHLASPYSTVGIQWTQGAGWTGSIISDTVTTFSPTRDFLTIDTSDGYLHNTGSLGAGTIPAARLHSLSTTEQLRLGYDANNFTSFSVDSTGDLTLTASGTNANINLLPSGTGKVGIGTSTPSSTLHVVGNSQFSATSTFGANVNFSLSGSILNFNSGDVTITHSSNLLTIGGGGLTATAGTATFGTLAGALDAGGATSFEVPNGAGGTTVDAAGETTVDTTTRTWNFHDGTAEVRINPEECQPFIIENPTASEDDAVFVANATSTITKIWAVNKSLGDTVTFNIVASSTRSAATSTSPKLFAAYTAVTATTTPSCYASATTTACSTGVFGTNASTTLNYGNVLRFSTTAASSSQFTLGICWRENP